MKLKFNSDAWYNGLRLYEAGKIYDVPDENGFAIRWLKRGAEEVTCEPKQKPKLEPNVEIDLPAQSELEVEIKKEVEETEFAHPVKPVSARGRKAKSDVEEL
jgi:hypothetical protein